MRGTGFVITEIVLWLVAAVVIGVVIGWLIRGWRSDKKIRRRVEGSVDEARSKAADLARKLADTEARIDELISERDEGEDDPSVDAEDEPTPDDRTDDADSSDSDDDDATSADSEGETEPSDSDGEDQPDPTNRD